MKKYMPLSIEELNQQIRALENELHRFPRRIEEYEQEYRALNSEEPVEVFHEVEQGSAWKKRQAVFIPALFFGMLSFGIALGIVAACSITSLFSPILGASFLAGFILGGSCATFSDRFRFSFTKSKKTFHYNGPAILEVEKIVRGGRDFEGQPANRFYNEYRVNEKVDGTGEYYVIFEGYLEPEQTTEVIVHCRNRDLGESIRRRDIIHNQIQKLRLEELEIGSRIESLRDSLRFSQLPLSAQPNGADECLHSLERQVNRPFF